MGYSASGIICYGIMIPEGEEENLPWYDEDYKTDFDDWWALETGYKPLYKLYDETGEHLPGVTEDMVDEYYGHFWEWRRNHPCPIEEVTFCHHEYQMYVVALKKTISTAQGAYPTKLDKNYMQISEEDINVLLMFCEKYGIIYNNNDLGWWLLGYYS